jgi:hypothetical protein
MATKCVRIDGHDSASGAANSADLTTGAWRTINKAAATLVAGDSLYLFSVDASTVIGSGLTLTGIALYCSLADLGVTDFPTWASPPGEATSVYYNGTIFGGKVTLVNCTLDLLESVSPYIQVNQAAGSVHGATQPAGSITF